MEIFQLASGICVDTIARIFYAVSIESTLYISTVIDDIKLFLVQIDRMASNGESELSMLMAFRGALELHNRVYE